MFKDWIVYYGERGGASEPMGKKAALDCMEKFDGQFIQKVKGFRKGKTIYREKPPNDN